MYFLKKIAAGLGLILSLAFLVFSAVAWVGQLKDPGGQLVNRAALIMAVSLLAALSIFRWTKRLEAEEQRAQEGPIQYGGEPIEVDNGWQFHAALLGILLIFGAGGILALGARRHLIGIFGLSLASIILVPHLLLAAVKRGQPRFRIDNNGISHFLYGHIPWKDVIGLSLDKRNIKGQAQYFLALAVEDLPRYRRRLPRWLRALSDLRLLGNRGHIQINLNGIDTPPRLVYEAVVYHRNRAGPPLEDWFPGMSQALHRAVRDNRHLAGQLGQVTDVEKVQDLERAFDSNATILRQEMESAAKKAKRQVTFAYILIGVAVLFLIVRLFYR